MTLSNCNKIDATDTEQPRLFCELQKRVLVTSVVLFTPMILDIWVVLVVTLGLNIGFFKL